MQESTSPPLTATEPSLRPRPGVRPDKRVAIMRAARTVFARDGYSRASIDVIATAADVSTRTIYNHFESKEQLFGAVLEASATEVADAFVERVDRDVTDVPDTKRDLMALGRALAGQATNFSEHFAMVSQINAETPHFPPEVLSGWKAAGPMRVQGEIERWLQRLADHGLLDIADAARATHHFVGLVASEFGTRSFYGAPPMTETEMADIVAAAVHVYLNGYAPR